MQLINDLQGNGGIFSKQVVGRFCRPSWTNSQPSQFSSSWSHLLPETVTLRRTLLVVTFAIFILCSLSVSQSASRSEKGTYIRDTQRDGWSLTIHNNWTMDTDGRADRPEVVRMITISCILH